MSALRLAEAFEAAFRIRLVRRQRSQRWSFMHRHAELVWPLRDRTASLALNAVE